MRPTVVLVGDVVPDRKVAVASRGFDADKPTRADVAQVREWLGNAGYPTKVFDRVTDFISAVRDQPRDIIVYPLWRGGPSRNRSVSVPAACEEFGIAYIGGDAFVHIVTEDKSLSKVFVRKAGFQVPAEWLVLSDADLADFRPSERLRPPFVVKPQYSGSSIGVEEPSLCANDAQAARWAHELFRRRLAPVICEEFIRGDEISLCFIEEGGRIVARCVSTVLGRDGAYPYRDGVLTFDEKARDDDEQRIAAWPHPIDPMLWRYAESLVRLLGKTDVMRIDGRLTDTGFKVIELTQDPSLAIDSELVGGFNDSGMPPSVFLDRLIQSSCRNQAK